MPRVPLGITKEGSHRNGVVLATKSENEIAWHVDISAVSILPINVLVYVVAVGAFSEGIF